MAPSPPNTPSPAPAPNPFTKDLKDPASPTPPAASPTPGAAGSPAAPVEPNKPAMQQKHKILIMAGVAVVFLILIAVIPAVILSSQKPKTGFTPTPTPASINNNSQTDAKARSELKQRLFLKATSTTRTAYDLTLTAPTAWNSTFTTTPTANYPWESGLLGTSLLTRFSPLSSANQSTPAGNYLAVIDATDWLATDKNNIPFPSVSKRGWFSALASVTADNAGNTGGAIANPRINSETNGRQQLTYVETADKQLKGISYITMLNDKTYDPQMITMMVGTLDKRSVVIFGVHGIRDASWATLTKLQASNDPAFGEQFSQTVNKFKSGQLGEDTKAIQKEFLEALRTAKITKIGQEAGTVQ